jgi:ABC-type phosphate/phosphonate transport system substrate-binding protein
MKKLTILTMITALCVAACITLSAGPASAKTYKFMMPVPEGLSIGSVATMMKNASSALEKITGYKIEVLEYKYSYLDPVIPTLLTKINKGELDFAMVFPTEYFIYVKTKGTIAKPLFSVNMFGKPVYNICFYTRKSDNITSASQLRGKVWGGARTKNARFLMHEGGIDEPIAKFFKTLKFMREESAGELLDALLAKKIDVFTLPDYQVKMITNTNGVKYKDVAAVKCTEYEHNWIIVYRKGMPEEDAMKLKSAFLSASKNKDFAQFQFLLTAIKGKFVEINVNEFKNTGKIAKLWQTTDWIKEENEYLKKNMKK